MKTKLVPMFISVFYGLYCLFIPMQSIAQDDINKKLIYATTAGDISEMQQLLEQDANCNYQIIDSTDKYYGYTPLHIAAINNNKFIVSLLLKENADKSIFSYDGLTALELANNYGNNDVAFLLADEKNMIFAYYWLNNNNEVIAALKKDKTLFDLTEANGLTIWHLAIRDNNNELLELLFKNKKYLKVQSADGQSLLLWSLICGNIDVAVKLVELGVNTNEQDKFGNTPYVVAKSKNYNDVVDLLIKNNTDTTNYQQQKLVTNFSQNSDFYFKDKSERVFAIKDDNWDINHKFNLYKSNKVIANYYGVCIDVSDDNNYLAIGDFNGEIAIYDILTGIAINKIHNKPSTTILSIQILSDQNKVVMIDSENSLKIIDYNTNHILQSCILPDDLQYSNFLKVSLDSEQDKIIIKTGESPDNSFIANYELDLMSNKYTIINTEEILLNKNYTPEFDKFILKQENPNLIANNVVNLNVKPKCGEGDNIARWTLSTDASKMIFTKTKKHEEFGLDTFYIAPNYLYISNFATNDIDSIDLMSCEIRDIKSCDLDNVYLSYDKVLNNGEDYKYFSMINLNSFNISTIDSLKKQDFCYVNFDVSPNAKNIALGFYGPSFMMEDDINGGSILIVPENCDGAVIKNTSTGNESQKSSDELGLIGDNPIIPQFLTNDYLLLKEREKAILVDVNNFLKKYKMLYFNLPYFYNEPGGESLKLTDDSGLTKFLNGHKFSIAGIAINNSLSKLLTYSYDYTIKLWDINSRSCETYIGNSNILNAKFFDNDSKIWALGEDGSIIYYDLLQNKILCTVSFFENGTYLVYTPEGYFDGTVDNFDNYLHFVKGYESIQYENYYKEFYRENLFSKCMSGEKL